MLHCIVSVSLFVCLCGVTDANNNTNSSVANKHETQNSRSESGGDTDNTGFSAVDT